MVSPLRLSLILIFVAQAAAAQVGIGFGGTAHDSSLPIEATSDTLSVDQETGTAVFSGNVLIVQGDLRLAAGEVEVILLGGVAGGDIERVMARGGVLVTRGDDAAEGAEAEYTLGEASLVLSGDVLVTQGPTAISGDRMTIDLASGSGTVSGRVRTVLQGSE